MKRIAIAALAALVASCSGDETDETTYDYEIRENAGVPEYGIIDRGGPVVLLLARDMDQTFKDPHIGPVAQRLARAEFTVVSMDLPSHHVNDNPYGLDGWRERIDDGEDTLFSGFCAQLSRVIDDLGATSVSAVGVSRGGYVAATCAARDARIQYLAMQSPVTDLMRLREFNGCELDQRVFGLGQYAPVLAGKKVLVRIGRKDERVGTDAAVAFAVSVGATLKIEFTEGHELADNGSTTRWLLKQQGLR